MDVNEFATLRAFIGKLAEYQSGETKNNPLICAAIELLENENKKSPRIEYDMAIGALEAALRALEKMVNEK